MVGMYGGSGRRIHCRGVGYLVPLVALLCLISNWVIGTLIYCPQAIPTAAFAPGAFLAAGVLWIIGRQVNPPGTPWKVRHSLEYLPVEHWSFIFGAIGLLTLLLTIKF